MEKGICPMCGAELSGCYDIHPTFTDGELFFEYNCKSCGCYGEEHYSYEFDGHYNYYKDED